MKKIQALLCSDVLGQEAELQLELLHQRDREVHGAPAFAAFHGLEVVLVALAPAVVEHVAGTVRRLEVVPLKHRISIVLYIRIKCHSTVVNNL